jgi:hypothetical protein
VRPADRTLGRAADGVWIVDAEEGPVRLLMTMSPRPQAVVAGVGMTCADANGRRCGPIDPGRLPFG